jgi:hypothetical protein
VGVSEPSPRQLHGIVSLLRCETEGAHIRRSGESYAVLLFFQNSIILVVSCAITSQIASVPGVLIRFPIEGFLKLFFCVYYADYVKEEKAPKKDGELRDVGGLEFEKLRRFFKTVIWKEKDSGWDGWIQRIQGRRNTIHAYNKREIGSFEEWRADLRIHLKFIRELNSRFPYPDG